MELLQLKYFCDAAESENFSKTAKKFGVPASNISQSIHRLEKEFGITFFDRTANRIKLNRQGKIFYEDTRKALLLLEGVKEKIDIGSKIVDMITVGDFYQLLSKNSMLPLIIFSIRILGKKDALKTLVGMIVLSICLDVTSSLSNFVVSENGKYSAVETYDDELLGWKVSCLKGNLNDITKLI